MEQKPSVGRIAHFVQYDGNSCQAAIITEVEADGLVGLFVFTADRGSHSQNECHYSENHEHGSWHWPERV